MTSLAVIHACAVFFWFGIVSVEAVIERSRTQSQAHGYAAAHNHYWIDMLLEVPAVTVVLLTGIALLHTSTLTPLLTVKIVAGLTAISINFICVLPVVRRKKAADAQQTDEMLKQSKRIDIISLIGVPAGLIAVTIGIFH